LQNTHARLSGHETFITRVVHAVWQNGSDRLQVRVVVHHRGGQRLDALGEVSAAAGHQAFARSRSSSSSTTDSSSLVNTGAGLAIGVPTPTGRVSQAGTPA